MSNDEILSFTIPHELVILKDLILKDSKDGIGISSSLTVYEDGHGKLLLLSVFPDPAAYLTIFYTCLVWIIEKHVIFHKMYSSINGDTANTQIDELESYKIGDILTFINDAYTEWPKEGA